MPAGLTTGFSELTLDQPLRPEYIATRNVIETFRVQPSVVQDDGTVASGVDAGNNVLAFEKNNFRLHNLGTQTIIVPVLEAAGLDISRDQTDNDGSELSMGILARSPGTFVVGTDAFYGKLTFTIADVSGTDDCWFGFRKIEAERPNFDDYLDAAGLNIILGAVKIETILGNAATVTTDTTNTWVDGATHTVEVYVAKSGAVTYKFDGVAPTVTAAYTFTAATTVMAAFYFLQATTSPGKVNLSRWEVGLQ